ncbi:MAG TPA: DUF3106 domain-containing protein [Verrucomicrobiae bacterium]|nr:DUF3106 domain-containing protein [Verrucomicrobiae bacterium]
MTSAQTPQRIAQAPAPATTASARPTPPLPQPPIAYFRELLALGPEELERSLSEKPEVQRKFLKAKLLEYTALNPGEREARLRATELRWYLRPLMETPTTNRIPSLARVPDGIRILVEQRLEEWDLLPPEVQRRVLENESIIRYFFRSERSLPAQRVAVVREISPERSEILERELAGWLALPRDRQRQMCDRFGRFFELPPDEKAKTLEALPDEERRQMEKTLEAFERLPAPQRRLCINSFSKFAGMTPDERAQFLKNAERWKEMTLEDRRTWRTLVTQLPPLPPGFGQPPLPPGARRPGSMPPLPPGNVNPPNATN